MYIQFFVFEEHCTWVYTKLTRKSKIIAFKSSQSQRSVTAETHPTTISDSSGLRHRAIIAVEEALHLRRPHSFQRATVGDCRLLYSFLSCLHRPTLLPSVRMLCYFVRSAFMHSLATRFYGHHQNNRKMLCGGRTGTDELQKKGTTQWCRKKVWLVLLFVSVCNNWKWSINISTFCISTLFKCKNIQQNSEKNISHNFLGIIYIF